MITPLPARAFISSVIITPLADEYVRQSWSAPRTPSYRVRANTPGWSSHTTGASSRSAA
jgi:hypothetical protein